MKHEGGNPDFEIRGLERDAVVWWSLVFNSPCLKCCVQLGGIIPPMKSSMSSDIFSVTLKFLH